MSLFGRLFGNKTKEPVAEVYNGYRIFAEPMKDDGYYRLCARIELDTETDVRVHQMIRADTFNDEGAAADAAIAKAKQVIDQQGEKMFRT